jgi:hypothetical protein
MSLGCEVLSLMGKLDLVSADPEGGEAVPVETKKSRVPNTPERSYQPERNQLIILNSGAVTVDLTQNLDCIGKEWTPMVRSHIF